MKKNYTLQTIGVVCLLGLLEGCSGLSGDSGSLKGASVQTNSLGTAVTVVPPKPPDNVPDVTANIVPSTVLPAPGPTISVVPSGERRATVKLVITGAPPPGSPDWVELEFKDATGGRVYGPFKVPFPISKDITGVPVESRSFSVTFVKDGSLVPDLTPLTGQYLARLVQQLPANSLVADVDPVHNPVFTTVTVKATDALLYKPKTLILRGFTTVPEGISEIPASTAPLSPRRLITQPTTFDLVARYELDDTSLEGGVIESVVSSEATYSITSNPDNGSVSVFAPLGAPNSAPNQTSFVNVTRLGSNKEVPPVKDLTAVPPQRFSDSALPEDATVSVTLPGLPPAQKFFLDTRGEGQYIVHGQKLVQVTPAGIPVQQSLNIPINSMVALGLSRFVNQGSGQTVNLKEFDETKTAKFFSDRPAIVEAIGPVLHAISSGTCNVTVFQPGARITKLNVTVNNKFALDSERGFSVDSVTVPEPLRMKSTGDILQSPRRQRVTVQATVNGTQIQSDVFGVCDATGSLQPKVASLKVLGVEGAAAFGGGPYEWIKAPASQADLGALIDLCPAAEQAQARSIVNATTGPIATIDTSLGRIDLVGTRVGLAGVTVTNTVRDLIFPPAVPPSQPVDVDVNGGLADCSLRLEVNLPGNSLEVGKTATLRAFGESHGFEAVYSLQQGFRVFWTFDRDWQVEYCAPDRHGISTLDAESPFVIRPGDPINERGTLSLDFSSLTAFRVLSGESSVAFTNTTADFGLFSPDLLPNPNPITALNVYDAIAALQQIFKFEGTQTNRRNYPLKFTLAQPVSATDSIWTVTSTSGLVPGIMYVDGRERVQIGLIDYANKKFAVRHLKTGTLEQEIPRNGPAFPAGTEMYLGYSDVNQAAAPATGETGVLPGTGYFNRKIGGVVQVDGTFGRSQIVGLKPGPVKIWGRTSLGLFQDPYSGQSVGPTEGLDIVVTPSPAP